jgi:TonB-linked SusC/RagA family outer membrane protein
MLQVYLNKIKLMMICVSLIFSAYAVHAQSSVKGKVISLTDNSPLPGVNVVIKGTTNGTTTDANGEYAIQATPEDVLVFSFIGFLSEEAKVGTQTKIDMMLSQSLEELLEVVVVGYSEKKKQEITGAISNLSIDEIEGVTGSNIEYMLQGKVSGVQVSTTTGAPGSNAEIKIRGTSSINAERPPLMVVDGIIGGSYNPNDVESLTVLKDAGAVALYGSRANSGVIIVTTKRGKTDKLKIDYKGTAGIRQITTGNFQMMSGSEIYETERNMFASSTTFKNFRPSEDLKNTNHDWLNLAYHDANIFNHNIALSQKLDKISFYLGADYFKEEGTLLHTNYERLNVRSNIDYKLGKSVKLSTNVNIITDKNNYSGEWQWTYNPYLYLPYDNPYDAEGNIRYVDGTTTDWFTRDKLNVVHNADYNSYSYRSTTINADAILTVPIRPWLDFQSRNRISMYMGRDDQYKDARTIEGRAVNGQIGFGTDLNKGAITTNLLKFTKDLSTNHHFSGFVGVEGAHDTRESAGATAIGIASGLTVPGAASSPNSIVGNKFPTRAMSFLSEVSYDFKGKYFVSGSFRRDGSSVFGKDKRWGNFPALSAAWLMSNEDFMVMLKPVSLLKLRASYGVIGNDNIPLFQSLAKYNFLTQYAGRPGGYPATLPNPDLSWEETKTANIGVDLELFKKLEITIDAYSKVTDQLLLYVQLPTSQGFEQALRNVGQVSNKGLEFSIGGDVVAKGKFKWNTSFNIGFVKNNVDNLPGGKIMRVGGDVNQLLKEGEGLGSWYMPKWMGVDPANGDPLWEKITYDAEGNETAKEITNVYEEATYQIVGNATPDFFGGWTNVVSYRGFSLNVTASYQSGNEVYHRTREFVDSDGAFFGFNLMKLQDGWNRWENAGDNATHPKLVYNGNKLSSRTSSRYLEDGSFIRVRNITLSYNLPLSTISKIRMSSAQVFVSGDNLFTFTKFSGLDPEVNSFSNTNYYQIGGVSDFKYPINKQYLVGIRMSF